jgi:hypothetical protein
LNIRLEALQLFQLLGNLHHRLSIVQLLQNVLSKFLLDLLYCFLFGCGGFGSFVFGLSLGKHLLHHGKSIYESVVWGPAALRDMLVDFFPYLK